MGAIAEASQEGLRAPFLLFLLPPTFPSISTHSTKLKPNLKVHFYHRPHSSLFHSLLDKDLHQLPLPSSLPGEEQPSHKAGTCLARALPLPSVFYLVFLLLTVKGGGNLTSLIQSLKSSKPIFLSESTGF